MIAEICRQHANDNGCTMHTGNAFFDVVLSIGMFVLGCVIIWAFLSGRIKVLTDSGTGRAIRSRKERKAHQAHGRDHTRSRVKCSG